MRRKGSYICSKEKQRLKEVWKIIITIRSMTLSEALIKIFNNNPRSFQRNWKQKQQEKN